jgi:hypothetical protein
VRYYRIDITKADGTPYQFKSLSGAGTSVGLTSLLPSGPQNPQQGLYNPACLLVELNIAGANMTDPDLGAGAAVTVWGLGLQDLGNAADLNGLNISVYAGMSKGLPLANPQQAGLICKGKIYQAFGNWIGTDQTLNLTIQVGGDPIGSSTTPTNFPFSMPKGTTLGAAVQNTLKIAMPNMTATVNVSPNLVLNYDQQGHYESLERFSGFVRALSQGIIGGTTYTGVTITQNGDTVTVDDGTVTATPKAILPQDLIGQPTWIGFNQITFKTVLRSDIHLNDYVTLPQTLFTQSAISLSGTSTQPQNKLTFSGRFQVSQIHHYGHTRQPDAASWNTTYQASFQPASSSTAAS